MSYTIHNMNTMSDPLLNQILPSVTDIMKLRLGKDFKMDLCRMFVGIDHQVVVGAASYEILSAVKIGKMIGSDEMQGDLYSSYWYGFLAGVAVREDYENRGIGTALAQARIDYLVKKKVRGVYATAWRGERVYAGPMLEKVGLKAVKELPGFYSKQSDCPVCGNGNSCGCSAVLYYRPLQENY